MRKFEIFYCFTVKRGKKNFVETDEYGNEIYNKEIVTAYNGAEAIEKFKKLEQFKNVKPEIWEVRVLEEQR